MKSLVAGLAMLILGAASAAYASTAAFVYETADVPNTNSSVQAIYGYALSSGGQLTPIPGEPFGVGDGVNYYTACNGTYLFGISWGNPNNPTWQNILTYRIAANGALTKVRTTPAASYSTTSGTHYLYGPLALDHSGQFLYVGVTGGPGLYSDYGVMTFQVNHETGALDFLGETPFHGQDTSTIHFTGDDKYAFDENNYEYMVAGNKTLVLLGNATDAGFNGNYVDPDPLSNLAVLDNGQLQSWFVHADGNLSQHSSDGQAAIHTNLWPYNYSQMYFSPDGSMLALAGFGLDLYHFNGAKPMTNYKQLYAPGVYNSQTDTTAGTFVSIVGWDNDHHFITVNYDQPNYPKAAGPWYWEIYNATPSSVTQTYRAELPQQSYYGFAVQRLGKAPTPID
ncbi:MAG TPA: hypothetical protein VMD29_05545 [Terracidiphilus sp.]|nr:hypothetical protein [Terracidiphilus sp.]